MRKNKIKFKHIILMLLLYDSGSFAASETTKQLIHETLAKYGISAGGKKVCGTGHEPEYNKTTGVVSCKNDKQGDTNNCWDAESRLCKECPAGTIVSQKDHITCRQIVCPKGFKLVQVKDDKCPTGFKKKNINNNSCDVGFKSYTEQEATDNYTTQLTHCKNVKNNNN